MSMMAMNMSQKITGHGIKMIVSDNLVLTCEPVEGARWYSTKDGMVYRFTNGEWIDVDKWYSNLVKKQKEEGKMETAVQEVKFDTGIEEMVKVKKGPMSASEMGFAGSVGPVGIVDPESVEIFHFGDFTVARMKKNIDGKTWQGIGISRQSKDDQRNEKLGDEIAKGRARKSIELKTQGKGVVVRHPYMA